MLSSVRYFFKSSENVDLQIKRHFSFVVYLYTNRGAPLEILKLEILIFISIKKRFGNWYISFDMSSAYVIVFRGD